jgi:DNA-binding MarR family transcriptional regulator
MMAILMISISPADGCRSVVRVPISMMLTCQQTSEQMLMRQHSRKLAGVTETRWLDDDEQRMWRAFGKMRRQLDGAIERQLTTMGLSLADYSLLVPLSEAPGLRLRARELRRIIDWDRSRLSHQIRRMEQRGLIVREECPGDARGTIIRLTAKGRETIEAAAPGHVETVRRLFVDVLTSEEIHLLTGIADRVADRVAEDAFGPGKPACAEILEPCPEDSGETPG